MKGKPSCGAGIWWVVQGLLAFTLIVGLPALHAEPAVSGQKLKAALVLQLIGFVSWPKLPPQGRSFQVCVVGDLQFAAALRDAARDLRTPSGSPVEIRTLTSLKVATNCGILVVGSYDERQLASFLIANRGAPILTVGDTDEFLAAGGIVRFRNSGGRVSIDLSQKAAMAACLNISSRLLRLAHLIDAADSGARSSP